MDLNLKDGEYVAPSDLCLTMVCADSTGSACIAPGHCHFCLVFPCCNGPFVPEREIQLDNTVFSNFCLHDGLGEGSWA